MMHRKDTADRVSVFDHTGKTKEKACPEKVLVPVEKVRNQYFGHFGDDTGASPEE